MAKTYSGATASYKALIGAMKGALKECVEPTEAQKKTILELLGPLAGHISKPFVCESESETDSDSDGSDSEDSESDSEDSESDSESECDADCGRRKYRKGPRAMGRELYKKNGGTEAKWKKKSEWFKDNYYSEKTGK